MINQPIKPLKIATDMVTNVTKTLFLLTNNSGLVATLVTFFSSEKFKIKVKKQFPKFCFSLQRSRTNCVSYVCLPSLSIDLHAITVLHNDCGSRIKKTNSAFTSWIGSLVLNWYQPCLISSYSHLQQDV